MAGVRGSLSASEVELRSRLAAIVESSDDAIISKDLDGTVLTWNRGAERIYGYTADEVVGRSISILMEQGSDELEPIMDAIRRGERIDHFDTVRIRKDGTRIMLSVTVSPVRDAEGEIVGASTVARDVTERRRFEEELRRSNEDLEQFAYIASHDLSEPLRVIAGFVDLLARRYRGKLDEQADRFIDFTIGGVERMQLMIDDLLTFSRTRDLPLEPVDVDTRALVQEIVRGLEGQIAQRGMRVELGELPTVCAEPTVLRVVLGQLISNAIKFAADTDPWMRIGASREAAGWRFEVRDHGPGIEPRHADRVFEMFQRLHGRQVPGSGMGLAIAKRLVERQGGKIWVEQAPAGGSVFSFSVPDE